MIIRRSTDGWSPPPPPSSDELTFRGPKHPIMLLGRFCPNYFLSNHYYYILCFCSLAYYALYGIVDLVIICRFISLFCPDLSKYVFSPHVILQPEWSDGDKQMIDGFHFLLIVTFSCLLLTLNNSLIVQQWCIHVWFCIKKTLRTITEDQDKIILLNVCVQKIVHISVTLHCSPSLP